MKYSPIVLSLFFLGCSFGGFKPAPQSDHWRLHNFDEIYPKSDKHALVKYVDRKEGDMKACGMDFVSGESDNPKVNLCMESKGWYLKGGPVCEEMTMWDRPVCIEWRKKHSKPDVKPWGCKKYPTYPTCKETGSKR
ncbi:hypothetical protein BKK51_10915 [Rodentibacter trehalosifermentans]|uniref:Uncharacterized protein n=1 Tax=Rodentibacter trehalosifermentans TaxID=1908263 RepID=A0A1V3IS17_9PAST|nr:hypothetical protein [Rodentibacter trehalosifermentans]OOF43820.1 hypothetical protein BKK51_10915 [Rodentibacter trehalosifermentans]OOF45017.1 hypothetical protein BKK52_12940 [Rodentibacter trehalosifermentans]